jgi:hypothetical protein
VCRRAISTASLKSVFEKGEDRRARAERRARCKNRCSIHTRMMNKYSTGTDGLSGHRSNLARIPLEKLCSCRGDLLVYLERAATSSARDDLFTSASDDPLFVSLPGQPQAVPDPRWRIPPYAWATVLQWVEQGEPLPARPDRMKGHL